MIRNYLDIDSLESLDEAIAENKVKLKAKEYQLKRNFDRVRGFYTPATLITQGVKQIGRRISFSDIALYAIGLLRKRLTRG